MRTREALGSGFQPGITAGDVGLEPAQGAGGGDALGQGRPRGVDGAAGEEVHFHLIRAGLDDAHVGGGLHQARNVRAHGLDAVGQGQQQADQGIGVGAGHDLGGFTGFQGQVEAGIVGAEGGAPVGLMLRQGRPEGLLLRGVQEDLGRGFAGDGVALVAALDGGQAEREGRLQGAQDLGEDADGIAPAGVDVDAGVAALEAEHLQPEGFGAGGCGRAGELAGDDGVDRRRRSRW